MKVQPAGQCQAGFTLLEVMVALSIMAIVLVSVYRLQSQTLTMSLESRFYTQAPLLAQSALSLFEKSQQRDLGRDLGSDEGDFGREYQGYRWKITVEDMLSSSLGAEMSKDMKKIEVLVTLNEGEYTYGFRTYRFTRQ